MPPKAKTPRKKDKDSDKQQSVEEQFQNVEISTKDPRTVVLMLDSPEVVIICKTCEALKKYVEISESNCLEVMQLGSLPRLVKLLSSPEKVVRSYAVLCLASMVGNEAVRRALYKLQDCVRSLLMLLAPEEELISQERASFSLSQMALEYSCKVQLEKHSAHLPLVKLLQSADPDVQRNSVKAICLMVEHYQSRPGILEAGGLPLLLELLASEYAVIQELALQALHSCMQNADCRKAIVDGDGLEKLVSFLGNKDCSDLHVLALSVLSLCLDDAESMVALQSSGCLQQLLQHITSSTSPDMKQHAARTLAKAATNSVNCKILHEQCAEKTFLDLLSSEDGGVVESGCSGLRNMSSLQSSCQFIGSEGGLAVLVQCAQSEVGTVRTASAHTIATLINGAPANSKLLAEAGGVEVIVKLLTDSMAEARRFASECVTTMAPDESLRCQIEEAGAVDSLVDCLNFTDSAVQSSSVEALGMLCCNASARQQFSSTAKGVASLLQLLYSTHEDVVCKATWALSVCARSPAVAEAICKMGGLEVVEKISKSSGHARAATANSALSRLLDSNISAKYWVTGCLEPSDLIKDIEFFDAGLAWSSSHPFTPLSELVTRSLNGNQPVMTVNLLAKPPPPTPVVPLADEGGTPAQNIVDCSQSTGNVGSRSKSRQQGGKRRSRPEKETQELATTQEVDQISGKPPLPGLLEVDSGLWIHISHTQNSILPLASPIQQVKQLAMYVSEQMGGAVERSGPLGYELPASQVQYEQQNNSVPLGEIKIGTFQQRALLFKVLCDQVGVVCSLERGEYGRHWNKVWLAPPTHENNVELESKSPVASVYVIDLMFEPGTLLPDQSTAAELYQHL